jgi:hypothetical protein
MSLVLLGSTSGSVTLQEPAVAGSTVITLPATSGTLLQSGTTVTEAQGGTGTTVGYNGFKNRLINGQLNINQRGVSGTVTLTAGSYGHDRFKGGASGCTYTFATLNNVTTLTISAGSLIQVVEGLNLESGTYTLSFTGTAQGKIGAGSFSASGVTGSITGGTNTNIEFNTGTLSLPQLEKGSTATSFDYRSYGTELAMCQRYCCVLTSGGGNAGPYGGLYSSTAGRVWYKHPVTMRASPTLSGTSGTGTASLVGVGTANCTVANTFFLPEISTWDLTSLSTSSTLGLPLVYIGAGILSAEL